MPRLPPLLRTLVLAVSMGSLGLIQAETSRQLLVTVVDARARSIVDLGPDDFVVAENGRPREVFSVHPADYPLVLLVDAGRTDEESDAMRAAAERFIERIGGERQVGLGMLSATTLLVPIDADRAAVVGGLQRIQRGGSGRRALASIAAAVERLEASELPFAAIVVLCDAISDTTPTSAQAALLGTLAASRARVHVIARSSSVPEAPDAEDLLRRSAALTRGHFTRIFAAASYQAAIDRLADALAAEMMVEYLVPAGDAAVGAEIGVKLPGARVIALGASK
jgi:hypothetical protein